VIVQALAGAKKPLIISGTNAGSMEIIQAAANVAKALKGRGADVGVTMVARAVNSVGLGMIGGGSLEEALDELESGAADAVIVLENDLHRHASAARVDAALAKAPLVMVVDHQRTAIMDKAHLVLSAASFAESDGTVVNNEGRAQRFFQVYDPAYYDAKTVMLESWRWLHSLHSTVNNRQVDWTQLDHVIDAAIAALPQLAGIKDAAPDATFRIRGQKLAREPHRYSGRTAMRANISVHEPRQPQDKDTMFAFSMEGNNQPSARVRRSRSPGRRAGTPRRHGTSSRMKWAGNCATAIRAFVCLKRPPAGWSTSPRCRPASRRKRANGVSRRTTTCSAAMSCHSARRCSRAGCLSRTSS
jgi:NADH-quinone oxidoreductase subunit G